MNLMGFGGVCFTSRIYDSYHGYGRTTSRFALNPFRRVLTLSHSRWPLRLRTGGKSLSLVFVAFAFFCKVKLPFRIPQLMNSQPSTVFVTSSATTCNHF